MSGQGYHKARICVCPWTTAGRAEQWPSTQLGRLKGTIEAEIYTVPVSITTGYRYEAARRRAIIEGQTYRLHIQQFKEYRVDNGLAKLGGG